jgi:D-glycero-alpha-D-manno-heptose-7-phosphate kinase
MILTKCPVRIGLAGGSTDLDSFIEKYGKGSVINFPINVYSYIFLHKDVLGYNTINKKYTINYSKREEVDDLDSIKNDVVKQVLSYFDVDPCWITMTSDVFSVGSGLALSSSYINSLIKAVSILKNKNISNYKIAELAMKLERNFNPLLGYQDTYGCGIGGLKRIDIVKDKIPKIQYLNTDLFDNIDMYLIYTGICRSSTNVLKSIEIKNDSLLHLVDEMEDCIINSNLNKFINIISEGWKLKKETSSLIVEHENLKKIDKELEENPNILCHRLCGAGNGGFFMAFTKKNIDTKLIYSNLYCKKVFIDYTGVTTN